MRSLRGSGWVLLNVLQAAFLVVWSVVWISLALVARILTFRAEVPLWMARTFWAPGLLLIGGARVEIVGCENVDWSQPHVFAVNHQSMVDVPLCFAMLPANLRFVAKKVLSYVPFLGWYMWATGMIFVDRGKSQKAIRSIRRAAQRVRAGASILAFPEGTRSRDGQIGPFKKGAILLALEAGVPVVPVAIEGASDVLPADGFRVRPGTVRMAVGRPIPTQDVPFEERDALVARVRDAVVALHRGLRGEAATPAATTPVPVALPAVAAGTAPTARPRYARRRRGQMATPPATP